MRDVNGVKTHGDIQAKVKGTSGFVMTPLFASGQVLVSSLLDNVLYQAYSKTHILDLIKLCCGVRFKQAIELDQMLGIDSSNICLINTPPEFVVRNSKMPFKKNCMLVDEIIANTFFFSSALIGRVNHF